MSISRSPSKDGLEPGAQIERQQVPPTADEWIGTTKRDKGGAQTTLPADKAIYTLDLSPIRAGLGRHWSLYADVVFGIAELIINKSIGPRDTYARDGLTIKIGFDLSSDRDIAGIFRAIESKITQTFLANHKVFKPEPESGDRLRAPPREPGWEALRTGVDAKAPGSALSNAISSFRPPDRNRALKPAISGAARPRMRARTDGAAIEDDPPSGAGAAGSMNGLTHGRVQFIYRPIWKIDNRLIAIYRATPTVIDGTRMLMGDAILTNPWSRDLTARLDELTLSHTLFDLEAHTRQGLNVAIVIPIHLASFVDERWSKALLKLCRKIPESARGHVVFEVLDALHVRSDLRFKAAMRDLRPFCRRFGAMIPPETRDFGFLRELGFATVSVETSEQPGTEVEIIDLLQQLYMSASREDLLTAAWGLRTRSLVLAAATIGYDFVNGQMIGGLPTGVLLSQVDYQFEDLYAEDSRIAR